MARPEAQLATLSATSLVPPRVVRLAFPPVFSLSKTLADLWPIALAGNRLGAVRDAKGKSVAQVFAGLGASQKAEVGSSLCCVLGYGVADLVTGRF